MLTQSSPVRSHMQDSYLEQKKKYQVRQENNEDKYLKVIF